MSKETPFLRLVAHKLNVNAKDVANFLQIDRRTLYNYANYTLEQLPMVVQEKYIEFFNEYEQFRDPNLDIVKIVSVLNELSEIDLVHIRVDFVRLANEQKKQRILQREGLIKSDTKTELALMYKLLADFGLPVRDYNVTKGYLYSLFEVIFSKIDNENDYQLIDYINRYQKPSNKE